MKDLLFILFALVLISSCSQTTKKIEKTDAEKYGLRGKVKSIRISNFKAKENFGIDVIKDGRSKESWRTVDYGEDSCYKFNELGRFIEREWLPYDNNDQYIKSLSKFDNADLHVFKEENIFINNKLVRMIETLFDNNHIFSDYTYSKDGKLDSMKICRRNIGENSGCSNGNVFVKYKYDVNGFIASETFVNNGEIRSNNIYTCDKNGNIKENKEYGYNGHKEDIGGLISTKNYEYDELNRVVLEKTISNPPDFSRDVEYRFEYYKNGKIALKEYKSLIENKQNIIYCNYSYEYNGDLISTHISANQGLTIETFKYTYDNMNNWIKKIGYTNDKPITITERSIDYF